MNVVTKVALPRVAPHWVKDGPPISRSFHSLLLKCRLPAHAHCNWEEAGVAELPVLPPKKWEKNLQAGVGFVPSLFGSHQPEFRHTQLLLAIPTSLTEM